MLLILKFAVCLSGGWMGKSRYFLQPVLGLVEKPKGEPESIAKSVHKRVAGGSDPAGKSDE